MASSASFLLRCGAARQALGGAQDETAKCAASKEQATMLEEIPHAASVAGDIRTWTEHIGTFVSSVGNIGLAECDADLVINRLVIATAKAHKPSSVWLRSLSWSARR